MAGTKTAADVPVEILVKQNVIPPVGVLRIANIVPKTRAAALFIQRKYCRKTGSYLLGKGVEINHPARSVGKLHKKTVTIEVMIFFQRLD